jgi:hypothetical protein
MKTARFLIVCLPVFAFASCADDGDARRRFQRATDAASEYTKKALGEAETSIVAVREQIEALIPAIEEKDLERLKTVCGELDELLDTDVPSFYYRAFKIEFQSGPASAQAYLADKLSDSALSDGEKRPLRALKAYFDAKGTISTKDAALMVVAIALEVKIGHGRGAILVVPFMDDPGEAFSTSEENESLLDDIPEEPTPPNDLPHDQDATTNAI